MIYSKVNVLYLLTLCAFVKVSRIAQENFVKVKCNGFVPPTWTWAIGGKTINQMSLYNELGAGSINNNPRARRGAGQWINDSSMYLFGGESFNGDILSDFWHFDAKTCLWTCISDTNQTNNFGNYGALGLASSSNIPSSRSFSATWVDKIGNLWLFGGFGYANSKGFITLFYNESVGHLNDLWRFEHGNWTWVSGLNAVNNSGRADGIPGARSHATTWTIGNDLYLFGGKGFCRQSDGALNDLWRFNGTWISVFSDCSSISNNYPSPRYGAMFWKDSSNRIWLFGGTKDEHNIITKLNDLWIFEAMNWRLISESHSPEGVYNTIGLASAISVPAGRSGGYVWVDAEDNFWIFGGMTKDSLLNDLWRFDGRYWMWISGTNTPNRLSIYGNSPGGRTGGAFVSDKGHLWMWGGYGFDNNSLGYLSDLWLLNITLFSASNPVISESEKSIVAIAVGASVGSVAFIIIVIVATFLVFKRKGSLHKEITETELPQLYYLSDVQIKSKIGGGNFGEVFLAVWKSVEVAAKRLKDSSKQEEFKKELNLLSSLGNHPNLVQFFGTFKDIQNEEYMIVEFCRKGSLLDFLRKKTFVLSIQSRTQIIAGICSGMEFLEGKSIVHRDLSARNCLVTELDGKLVVKVSDFGMGRNLEKEYYSDSSATVPVRWTAPEALKKGQFTSASDVWSFGVVCWEVFSDGTIPYDWLSNREVSEKVLEGLRLTKPTECPEDLWEIIKQCWNEDTAQRPKFSALSGSIKSFLVETGYNASSDTSSFSIYNTIASPDQKEHSEEYYNNKVETNDV